MFKKLHLHFTFFCTIVTSLIMIAMTFICLNIMESDASRQSFLSFRTNVSSMLSYLNGQSIISHQWLLEMENSYGFHIKIEDNGNDLYYNLLNYNEDVQKLFDLAEETAATSYEISVAPSASNSVVMENVEFDMGKAANCYGAVALIPKETGTLSVTVIHPLAQEQAQILHQRLIFGGAACCAVLLFAVFSWFFTRHMLKPVEESRRKQTQFIAAASHELRTPLTVILSSLSAMEGAPACKQKQFASHIKEEGQHMNRLISDMLVLANADNSNWSISPAPTEPDTLLLNVYEKYQPAAEDKKLCWNIQLPDAPVPPLMWDKDRISQVLGILVDNAISYTPERGEINLILTCTKNVIEYRVSDNGPGVPDDKKSAVFQRFYRLDESHHDKAHFGLGLCIAEEIIRMHKGKLWIEDTPGGGATFVIRLGG